MIFARRAKEIQNATVSALAALVLLGSVACSGPTLGRTRRDASDISETGGSGGFGGTGGTGGTGGFGGAGGRGGSGGAVGIAGFGGTSGSGGTGGGSGSGGAGGAGAGGAGAGGADAGVDAAIPDAAVPDAAVDAAVTLDRAPDLARDLAAPDLPVDASAPDVAVDLARDLGPDVAPGLVGLIGYWKFDEPSGGTAEDSSPFDNTGALAGSSAFSTSHFTSDFANAGSVSLDGNGDYVALGIAGLPGSSSVQTISLWVNYTSGTGTRNFVSFTDPAGGCGLQLGLRNNRVAAWKWGGTELAGKGAPATGAWHNVIYMFDGITHSLIVDGAAAVTSTVAPQTCTVREAQVGAAAVPTTDREFLQGNVDDLRIYNRLLTASEIAVIATGGDPAVGPKRDASVPLDVGVDSGVDGPSGELAAGLVGHWKLDEGTGTVAADSSPSGNTGTIAGGPTWSTGFPAAQFTNPHSIVLDGADDQIQVGITRMPALDQPRSVSLWFNYAAVPASGNDTFFSITNHAINATMGAGFQMGTRGNDLAIWALGGTIYLSIEAPAAGWHHLVYTFDGTNHVMYLDNVLAAASTVVADRPQNHPPAEALIGNYINGSEYFTGRIDDIRVWNRTLTAGQVAALFGGR